MTTWKILVWTRFEGDPEPIVARCLDPRHVAACLPPGLRWTTPDPDALSEALHTGRPTDVATQIRTPLAVIPWPLHLHDVTPGLRVTTTTVNPWFTTFIHRRRFERALGGHTRYVDELVITPAKGWPPLVARGVTHTLQHLHRRLAADLPADPRRTAVTRSFRLAPNKAAHADALLDGIDLT